MRAVWCLCLLASPLAAEPFLVLRGDGLATAKPELRVEVETYAERCAKALREIGVPVAVVSDQAVTAPELAAARLVILPYNRVDDALVDKLKAGVAAGARMIAFYATGSPRLPALLGVRAGPLRQAAYEGELAAIEFTPAARQRYPGLPPAIRQNSWHALELTPLPGARIFGEWGRSPLARRPAIVENAAGWFVGHVLLPGDLPAKGLFLTALAARAEPDLWLPVATRAHAELGQATAAVEARWAALEPRVELPLERRLALRDRVVALTARVAAAPLPATTAAGARLELYRTLTAEARDLIAALQASPAHELRGLWVFGGRPLDWPKLASRAKLAGLNAIFYRVSRGGSAVYPSAVLPQESWAAGRDEVATALAACRRYGLEFHAWRVCFHLGSGDSPFKRQMVADGRVCLDVDGRPAPFLSPADPRNRRHELAAVAELLDRYDLDGLHLDYIRYPEEPHYGFDYSPVARREFEQASGEPVADWPAAVVHGARQVAYETWLRQTVDQVVREIAARVHTRSRVVLSAAVWRKNHLYKHAVKQDWPRWVKEGWLDLVVPMDYTTDPAELAEEVAAQVALTGGSARLAAGLGAWLLDRPERLLEEVEAVRSAGADGFVLFSSNAPDLEAQLAALKLGATAVEASPATRAPTADWRLPTALERGDRPPLVLAGAPCPVGLVLDRRTGTERQPVTALTGRLSLRRPATGEELAEVGTLVALGSARAEWAGAPAAPAGRWQLIFEGQADPGDGRLVPVVVRGPVLEGVEPAEFDAWRARLRPPAGAGRLVGVWHDGQGAAALLAALADRPGVTGVPLYRLTPEHLASCAVVVITPARDLDPLRTEAARAALRARVEAGGTLLLSHEAVGHRWHPSLFPEFARGDGARRGHRVVTNSTLGDLTFAPAWPSHVTLAIQPAAAILAREEGSARPVIARGRLGRGEVLLCGVALTPKPGATVLSSPESALLEALLELPTKNSAAR